MGRPCRSGGTPAIARGHLSERGEGTEAVRCPWRRGGVLDAGARARLGIDGPTLEVVAVTPAKITVQMSLAEWYKSLGDGTLVCVKASDA